MKRTKSITFRCVALLTALVMVMGSCGPRSKTTSRTVKGGGGDQVLVQAGDVPAGLTMTLSNGRQGPQANDHSQPASTTKMADADANALLDRVSPIQKQPADQSPFALRSRSEPPPRTGKTVKTKFPGAKVNNPPGVPATNDKGAELTVLRWAPEGDIPLAPQLQVTFSQAMVAVTSHADTVAGGVPVTLSPQPPGQWRWVGTKTLLFDPTIRFPQATTYTVTIPKGTASATGNLLKEEKKFTFTTPPPTLQNMYPSWGPHHTDVPFYVQFDQKIDAAAVLAKIKLTGGKKTFSLVQLTADEIAKDTTIKSYVEGAKASDLDGRWIAFKPTEELPKDTHFVVTIEAGTPSAEGPNTTASPQSFDFFTYPPLRIDDSYCGWHGSPCPPQTPFSIQFNNPLDVEQWDDAHITVEPEIPGLKIQQSGQYVTIWGRTKGRTKYTVKVSGGVLDDFAQTLGKDVSLTFRVGDAYPEFYGPQGMVVVDPAAKTPTYDVFTTNYESLKVRLYAVEPSDFRAFAHYVSNWWDKKRKPKLPGKKVFDELVQTHGAKDELTETAIDLTPALNSKNRGHVVAVVEPYPWKEQYAPPMLMTWLQVSKVAVDAYVDGEELIAWATKLADGKPASGVSLEMKPSGLKATTDTKGMAKFALPDKAGKGAGMVVATDGDDVGFVLDNYAWYDDYDTEWVKGARTDSLRWYVTDDRHMYRPGEEVHLKGWLRRVGEYEGGDVAGIAGMVSTVDYKVMGPMGNEMATGTAKVSAAGGWDATIKLPETPNLGYAYVYFTANGRMTGQYSHSFQIEEFRRPEYEVKTEVSQGPQIVGGSADITATASYYAGGGLGGAPVSWWLSASETTFTPPNRDEYVFGTWQPWWGWRSWWDNTPYPQGQSWSHSATTDALGQHVLHLDFTSVSPAVPMSVTAYGSVTDVNRQTWSSTATLLVHPAKTYIGVKTKKPFVEMGTPIELDGVIVDLDGKADLGRPWEVKAVRLDWELEKGTYVEKELDPQLCTGTSGADPFACAFETKEGGQYRITAVTADADGRRNETKMTVWVAGGDVPPTRDVQQEQVMLIPDAKEYQDGDTAEILVQAPFYPASGLMSIRRSGIVSTERFELAGPTTTLKVPIVDGYVPDVSVQVDLVGKSARLDDDGNATKDLPDRVAYAMGSIVLPVPPKQRTLAVTIAPREDKVAPGAKTQLDVTVKDANGKAVSGAEVAVIAVDESILALTGWQFSSPIDVFYGGRYGGGQDYRYRQWVKLASPESGAFGDITTVSESGGGEYERDGFGDAEDAPSTTATGSGYGRGAGGGKSAPPPPPKSPMREEKANDKADRQDGDTRNTGGQAPQPGVALRTNFNPLAAFAPDVKTGADGTAVVDVPMPDNLTRYRLIAIAVAGDKQFGKGESAVTARLPLMVRPSPPRFLNFGDTFELPVIVQNQTDAAMTVSVAARATNADITDGAGRTVTVPANDRVEIRFPAAAEMAGTARFQLVASNGKFDDAAEVALPVWTPATTEAFATYGVVESGAIRQPVKLPEAVVTQFGGLEVETSSTQLQALTDAFLYLVTYPYECSEQIASRVLGIASLKDVLTAFKAEGLPPAADIERRVEKDLDRLESMQNWDGGFPVWQQGYESWPFLSVHVVNALVLAKDKGYAVNQYMIDRGKDYLVNIERYYPWYYSEDVKRTITSYALYVRKKLGDKDLVRAKGLIKEAGGVDKLSMEAVGWLLGVMAGDAGAATERKDLLRHLDNRATETAAAANWTTAYGDGAYLLLASDRRVDAVILESLIAEQKASDLIPKVVTGLLGHKKAGRWENTQENVFVLMALDRYFNEYEKVSPDFVARVWLGDDYAGDHTFKGHTTDRHNIDIPMSYVAAATKSKKSDLVIQKDGSDGRLYYRIGMTYAPESLKLDPADHGFTVERRYEAIDDPGDVTRNTDGSWTVKAGARVRVRLSMVAESRRYHVALVDPLPAGLEPMNPALAVTGPIPQDPNSQKAQNPYWWWYSTWYEHQNLRDERVEAFTTLLWEGVWEYTYVARATTPGNFVVPPTKAEEMYFPETFGRSGSDRVIVQ